MSRRAVASSIATARAESGERMDQIANVRTRGAFVYESPTTEMLDMCVDLAEAGAILPFRLAGPDGVFGFFIASEAGCAHVHSVHPDNRVEIAWHIGARLADGDQHWDACSRGSICA